VSPDPGLYARWVRAVDARLRPQIDALTAALRAEAARLLDALARKPEPAPTAAEEADLRAECARLEEEITALVHSVERAEKARTDELRAQLLALLAEAQPLLAATEAEHWRAVCRDADRLFGPALGRPAEVLSVNEVKDKLSASTVVAEVRAALAAGAEEAARQMSTTAGALDQLQQLEARAAECRAQIAASETRLAHEHGVSQDVLSALPAMAADRALHSALDDLVRDAQTEAAWALARTDVLTPFRAN
jgi:hypothetical protein